MTVIFRDTFTGTAGTLAVSHTPDIAPVGFAYADTGFGPNTVLQLDGTGHLNTVPIGYGTGGGVSSSASNPPLSLALTYPYTVTFTGRPTDTLGLSVTSLVLYAPDGSSIEIYIEQGQVGGTPPWNVYGYLESDAVGGGYFGFEQTQLTAAEHTVSLTIDATSMTVTIDGQSVALSDEFAGTTFNQIASMHLWVDGDHPVANAYIDLVEISDASVAAPPPPPPAPPATNPALPHITVPDGTPVFLAEGHAIDEQSVFAQVPFTTGHSRARRLLTAPTRVVSVSWLFEADEMAAIDDWYENTLLAGTRQFSAQVRNQGSGPALLWWAARWIEFSTEMLNLGRGRAGGRLLLVGEGSEAGPELGRLEAEITCALVDVRSNVYSPTPIAMEIAVALQQPQPLAMDVLVALVEDYLPTGARLTEDSDLRVTEDGDARVIN